MQVHEKTFTTAGLGTQRSMETDIPSHNHPKVQCDVAHSELRMPAERDSDFGCQPPERARTEWTPEASDMHMSQQKADEATVVGVKISNPRSG